MKDKPLNKPTSAIDELVQLLMLEEETQAMKDKPLEKPLTTVGELVQYIIQNYLKYLDKIVENFHVHFEYLKYEAGKPYGGGKYGEYTNKNEWLYTSALELIEKMDSFSKIVPEDLSFMVNCGMIKVERLHELFVEPVYTRIDALDELSKEINRFAEELK